MTNANFDNQSFPLGNIWAFLKNGIVINTVVFEDNEHENTIALFKGLWDCDTALECKPLGVVPSIGDTWNGTIFIKPVVVEIDESKDTDNNTVE